LSRRGVIRVYSFHFLFYILSDGNKNNW
jgi:hypothetical protein